MKLFLSVTTVSEILIGILLILFPKFLIKLLFEISLNEISGVISAMIAGIAITTLTIICWLLKSKSGAIQVVKGMFFYNFSIILAMLFFIVFHEIFSLGMILIIGFHTFLGLWSILIIRKNKTLKD